MASEDKSGWLTDLIREFINESPENTLQTDPPEKAFDDPLVGFAKGDDPIFEAFKDLVGPFHLTPFEVFSNAFPDSDATPADLTVISWLLPQTGATKRDNRKETVYPSERWARARTYGEPVNTIRNCDPMWRKH